MLCAFALAAALSLSAGEEEEGSSLEAQRRQLLRLQGEQQARKGPATSDRPVMAVPEVSLNMPSADAPEAWLEEKLKKQRKAEREKKAQSKNWLIDGMEKLREEDAAGKPGSTAAPATSDGAPRGASPVHASDPQYLLKLFDEQKKEAVSPAPSRRVAAPDPFAPFLQGWLASSPARGEFFDQFARRTEAPTDSPVSVQPKPGGGELSLPALEHGPSAGERGNPYLAEMSAPTPVRELEVLPGANSAPNTPWFVPDAVAAPTPPPPSLASPEPNKAPFASPADDRKYFPQLKRF